MNDVKNFTFGCRAFHAEEIEINFNEIMQGDLFIVKNFSDKSIKVFCLHKGIGYIMFGSGKLMEYNDFINSLPNGCNKLLILKNKMITFNNIMKIN